MFPERFTFKIAPSINRWIDALIADQGATFRVIGDALLAPLILLELLLRGAPWWLVVGLVAALAYLLSRRPMFAVASGMAMILVGVLGLWDPAMQTLALMLVAVVICILLGVPAGIGLARSPKVARVTRPLLDAMQTVPSFVYLVPAMMLFGLGKVPALIATVIYALPPIARLTEFGIRNADAAAVEAADAFGATPRQKLWHVELPLALPSIMTGVNQATMLALSMVVVASMIGARGLGEEVLLGIQRLDVGRTAVAGCVIVVLAIVIDRLTQSLGRRLPGRQ